MNPRTRKVARLTVFSAILAVATVVGEGLPAAPGGAAPADPAPAMQGHDAEAKMRDPAAEARHRRLFFDPALREEGEAQVSCDHRAAKRPDTVAGPAAVVILWEAARGRVLVRRWIAATTAIDLAAEIARLAEGAPAGASVDGLAFLRCR